MLDGKLLFSPLTAEPVVDDGESVILREERRKLIQSLVEGGRTNPSATWNEDDQTLGGTRSRKVDVDVVASMSKSRRRRRVLES